MSEYMEAIEINSEGNWVKNGEVVPLVGATIPVPKEVAEMTGGETEQEIIMMVEASPYLSQCPSCSQHLPESTIILLTISAKLMPVHCCNTLVWMKEKEGMKDGK